MNRCQWADPNNPDYIAYHDEEWGVPIHDDQTLFEFLTLEGAQAGLSWSTILAKRKGYRKAFSHFDVQRVSRYSPNKVSKLLQDPRIVRNRLKVESAISNAKAFLDIQQEFGSFNAYIWGFVNNVPIQNAFKNMSSIPAETELSRQISKDLKKRGFRFVGPTIIYAFMQAIGMVNDHTLDCFRYLQLN